jgi:Multicopper oxidase
VKSRFDQPGLYVWHCHIVEHEDNEMMRPYFIGPNPTVAESPTVTVDAGRAEQLGTANAKVTLEGQFADASLTDFNLGASVVTIVSVLSEAGVELVAGAALPLTLAARPDGDADGASFETPRGARPKVRLDMSRLGQGVVSFRLVKEDFRRGCR